MILKRIAVVLIFVLSAILLPSSAHADGQLPPPPTQYWDSRPLKDIRWGVWLPCSTAWNIVDDCIEGASVSKADGTFMGNLEYQPMPGFDPAIAKQSWIHTRPDGTQFENAPFYVESPGAQNVWKLPVSVASSEEARKVYLGVILFGSSFQINFKAWDEFKESLPDGYLYEIKIRSKSLSENSKWVLANFKNPQVKILKDVISVKGLATPSYGPEWGTTEDVCQTNGAKSSKTINNMIVNIMIINPVGGAGGASRPGDLVMGTNGWWCLADFKFDTQLRQLIVKVGNAHFDADGKVIQGWLDVKVKGARAKEWWGMNPDSEANNARVEITYQDGTTGIATSTSRYDKANDWISIQASGFTYSQPTLAISFKKPTTPAKATTLTCVKGKSTKKVSGIDPKCPSGFVKR